MHPQLRIGYHLISGHQISLARDHFRLLVERTPHMAPDTMTFLYRQLVQNPTSSGLHLLIAELHLHLNQPEDALSLLEEAYDNWPHEPQIYALLSKIHTRRGHHPAILTICEAAIANGITDGVLVTLLSQLYLRQDDIQKSIALFEQLRLQDPDHAPHKQSLAQLYQRNGTYAKALALYDELITAWPEQKADIMVQCDRILRVAERDADLLQAGAQIYLKGCAPGKAAIPIQALLTQFPDRHAQTFGLLRTALDVFPNTPELLLALSDLLIDQADYVPAATHLHQLIQSDPHFATDAVQRLEKITERSPQSVLAHGLLTEYYLSSRNFPSARHHLTALVFSPHAPVDWAQQHLRQYETIQSDPAIAPLQAGLQARLLAQRQQWPAAQQTARTALCLAPTHSELHPLLSSLYREGLRHRAMGLTPGSSRDRFQLGLMLLELGDIYPAIEQFQLIPVDDPLRNRAQLLIGRCFIEADRFDLAVNQLSRTLQLIQGDDRLSNAIRYLLATGHVNLGNIDTALQTLNTIFETDIHFPGISTAISQVRCLSFTEMRGKAIGILPSPFEEGRYSLLAVAHSDNAADPASRNWVTLNFSQVHNSQGITYWFQDNPVAAEEAFKIALQLDMESAIPYCNLAALAIANRDATAAKGYLENAEQRNHNLDTIPALRGILAATSGQLPDAEKHFSKALQLNAANAWVRLAWGDVYYAQKMYKSALQQWLQASTYPQISHLVSQRTRYLKPTPMLLDDWVLPNPRFFDFVTELLQA
jgi:tetratricopeptide (TPR) repeat protein